MLNFIDERGDIKEFVERKSESLCNFRKYLRIKNKFINIIKGELQITVRSTYKANLINFQDNFYCYPKLNSETITVNGI